MNTTRIQVIMSDDLLKRVDALAEFIGSSRSSICAAIISKSLSDWERVYLSPSDEDSDNLG